jgi:XTP/dITP diphosphohydrolase
LKILVASTNRGKIREIADILSSADVTIFTPDQIVITVDVQEDGATFEENALKKAVAYRDVAEMSALADDSGLCVDALDGAPGVMSARFAGPNASDADNIERLLKAMHKMQNRKARFVCVVALALPSGELITAQGDYPGLITETPMGSGGFGYDPVFYDPTTGKTFAELCQEEKNRVSHRKRALIALREKLQTQGYIKP